MVYLSALLLSAAAVSADFPPVTLRLVTQAPPSGGSCVSFRQTGNCDPDGPREPSGDQGCDATIPCSRGDCPSGYCECAGGVIRNKVTCKDGSHGAFTCAAACAGVPPPAPGPNGTALELSNGWTTVTVDLARPAITTLVGDMLGAGNFSGKPNALAPPGLRLEREGADGVVCGSSDAPAPASFKWTVLSNTSELGSVRLDGIADCAATPLAVESWTLSLGRDGRSLRFGATGALVAGAAGSIASVRAVRRVLPLQALSLYALFERGVVQMMGASAGSAFFGTGDPLTRYYAMGGGSSVDVVTTNPTNGTSPYSVLVSNRGGAPSALQDVVLGTLGGKGGDFFWGPGWSQAGATPVPASGTSWAASQLLTPNDRNFPAGGLSTGPNLPERDLEALLTGIYGSSVGCLCTFDNEVKHGERVAQIATTIAMPGRGYGGTYNYFDPDNFISLSAMIYSGDPYLQKQAQAVLMRSGSLLKVTNDKFNGQVSGARLAAVHSRPPAMPPTPPAPRSPSACPTPPRPSRTAAAPLQGRSAAVHGAERRHADRAQHLLDQDRAAVRVLQRRPRVAQVLPAHAAQLLGLLLRSHRPDGQPARRAGLAHDRRLHPRTLHR